MNDTKIHNNKNISLLRPLLDLPKIQIEQLCNEHNIPYSIDPTNENTAYSQRNKRRAIINEQL